MSVVLWRTRPSLRAFFRPPTLPVFGSAFALAALLGSALPVSAGAPEAAPDAAADSLAAETAMTKLYEEEKKLQYRTGDIELEGGLAELRLPAGYRYLDEAQTEKVLTEMWGNPAGGKTLGMILAPDMTPLKDDSWAVIIEYSDDGYVKDDDAEKIDYDDLLKDMQKSVDEHNKERKEQGSPSICWAGRKSPTTTRKPIRCIGPRSCASPSPRRTPSTTTSASWAAKACWC
jgi:uncharacterized membrane-anchored protein